MMIGNKQKRSFPIAFSFKDVCYLTDSISKMWG